MPLTISMAASTQPLSKRRPTSSHGFGCRNANDCPQPNAACVAAVLIGKCTCRAQADCTADEICVDGTCEVRCHNASQCLRGGSCEEPSTEAAHCVDLRRASEDEFNPTEWDTEAERAHPGHVPAMVRATYDEWDGSKRHLRVSFRSDGHYVIEVDGIGGSNRSEEPGERGNAKGKELLRTGFLVGWSNAVPTISYLHATSCKGELSSFRAELVLTAEFDELQTYRGLWTHPLCRGFPAVFVEAVWDFVNRETGGAIARFDRALWHKVPE